MLHGLWCIDYAARYAWKICLWCKICLGTIKNIILVSLANEKLDDVGHSVTEESESSLRDTNT